MDWSLNGKAFRMSEQARNKLSREERLAAKLRENLRRRKAQSRGLNAEPPGGDPQSPGTSKDICKDRRDS